MITPLVVILAIAAYFIMFFAVSHLSGRRSDNAAFFNAGRRVPWLIVALATISAPISGVTFISVPGMVADKGASYMQMTFGFVIGYLVIAYILVPLFYRRNLISIYGYLGQRFGRGTYSTGAWFFFISKMLGAAVRFFVVCVVLQALVFKSMGIPFAANVIVTVGLIWGCTFRGGVKSIIWTDVIKSICLIASVGLCIWYISQSLTSTGIDPYTAVTNHPSSRIFFFDNPSEGTYFWKQFIAGIFMVVAMTGLDQDMMQRNLACADITQCRKNMVSASLMQLIIIGMFLLLGTMLLLYIENTPTLHMPDKPDEIFSLVATHGGLPVAVGILFIIGLISVSYSAAASALVSLTTSFTVDILGWQKMEEHTLSRRRKAIHLAMAAIMAVIIVVFFHVSDDDAISTVYVLASYTYGPILGLFAFGMLSKLPVADRYVPAVCIAAPAICWLVKEWLGRAYSYQMSFELLLLNAALTIAGLWIIAVRQPQNAPSAETI